MAAGARVLTIAVLAGALLSGCGHFPPSPGQITQNYVNAIAGGDYASACALLDAGAQAALKRSMRSTETCSALLARCLPSNASQLEKDQAQLFYSNVVTSVSGSKATVKTSGTAVANRIREVTLAKQKGQWMLTSYGRQDCSTHRAGRRR